MNLDIDSATLGGSSAKLQTQQIQSTHVQHSSPVICNALRLFRRRGREIAFARASIYFSCEARISIYFSCELDGVDEMPVRWKSTRQLRSQFLHILGRHTCELEF